MVTEEFNLKVGMDASDARAEIASIKKALLELNTAAATPNSGTAAVGGRDSTASQFGALQARINVLEAAIRTQNIAFSKANTATLSSLTGTQTIDQGRAALASRTSNPVAPERFDKEAYAKLTRESNRLAAGLGLEADQVFSHTRAQAEANARLVGATTEAATITLYHGTTQARLPSVLETGLTGTKTDPTVYATSNPLLAARYALDRAKLEGSTPAIVSFKKPATTVSQADGSDIVAKIPGSVPASELKRENFRKLSKAVEEEADAVKASATEEGTQTARVRNAKGQYVTAIEEAAATTRESSAVDVEAAAATRASTLERIDQLKKAHKADLITRQEKLDEFKRLGAGPGGGLPPPPKPPPVVTGGPPPDEDPAEQSRLAAAEAEAKARKDAPRQARSDTAIAAAQGKQVAASEAIAAAEERRLGAEERGSIAAQEGAAASQRAADATLAGDSFLARQEAAIAEKAAADEVAAQAAVKTAEASKKVASLQLDAAIAAERRLIAQNNIATGTGDQRIARADLVAATAAENTAKARIVTAKAEEKIAQQSQRVREREFADAARKIPSTPTDDGEDQRDQAQRKAATLRFLAGENEYITALAESTVAQAEISAAVAERLAGERESVAILAEATIAEAALTAEIQVRLSEEGAYAASLARTQAAQARIAAEQAQIVAGIPDYRESLAAAKVAHAEETAKVQQILAADNAYIEATASAANSKRLIAAKTSVAENAGAGFETLHNVPGAGALILTAPKGSDSEIAAINAQRRAAGAASLIAEEGQAKAGDSFRSAQVALEAAMVQRVNNTVGLAAREEAENVFVAQRAENAKKLAAGELTEIDLVAQRNILEEQTNLAVKQQAGAARRLAFENSVAAGGPRGGIIQRFQANGANKPDDSNYRPPTDFATAANLIKSRFLTTAGFAISGVATYAAFSGIQKMISDSAKLEQILAQIKVQFSALGDDSNFAGFREGILSISRATGEAAGDVAKIAFQFKGAFGAKLSDSGILKEVNSAVQISRITGLSLEEVTDSLTATALNYGTTIEHIGDATLTLQDRTGVLATHIITAIADLAPVATDVGLSLEKIGAIAAVAQQKSGQSGQALAESLNRVLPTIGDNASKIAQFYQQIRPLKADAIIGDLARGETGKVFDQIGKDFAGLTGSQQKYVESLLGTKKDLKGLIPVFQSYIEVQLAEKAALDSNGRLSKGYGALQETLSQQLSRVLAAFKNIGQALLSLGLSEAIQQIAKAFALLIGGVSGIIGLFTRLNDALGGGLGTLVAYALTFTALYKVIKLVQGIGALSALKTIGKSIPGTAVLKTATQSTAEAEATVAAGTETASAIVTAGATSAGGLTAAGEVVVAGLLEAGYTIAEAMAAAASLGLVEGGVGRAPGVLFGPRGTPLAPSGAAAAESAAAVESQAYAGYAAGGIFGGGLSSAAAPVATASRFALGGPPLLGTGFLAAAAPAAILLGGMVALNKYQGERSKLDKQADSLLQQMVKADRSQLDELARTRTTGVTAVIGFLHGEKTVDELARQAKRIQDANQIKPQVEFLLAAIKNRKEASDLLNKILADLGKDNPEVAKIRNAKSTAQVVRLGNASESQIDILKSLKVPEIAPTGPQGQPITNLPELYGQEAKDSLVSLLADAKKLNFYEREIRHATGKRKEDLQNKIDDLRAHTFSGSTESGADLQRAVQQYTDEFNSSGKVAGIKPTDLHDVDALLRAMGNRVHETLKSAKTLADAARAKGDLGAEFVGIAQLKIESDAGIISPQTTAKAAAKLQKDAAEYLHSVIRLRANVKEIADAAKGLDEANALVEQTGKALAQASIQFSTNQAIQTGAPKGVQDVVQLHAIATQLTPAKRDVSKIKLGDKTSVDLANQYVSTQQDFIQFMADHAQSLAERDRILSAPVTLPETIVQSLSAYNIENNLPPNIDEALNHAASFLHEDFDRLVEKIVSAKGGIAAGAAALIRELEHQYKVLLAAGADPGKLGRLRGRINDITAAIPTLVAAGAAPYVKGPQAVESGAQENIDAANALAQAKAGPDPLAQAEEKRKEAQDAVNRAAGDFKTTDAKGVVTTHAGKTKAAKDKAAAALIEANQAVTSAIGANADAHFAVLTALADGDPLQIAQVALAQANSQAAHAQTTADKEQAEANRISAEHAIRDAVVGVINAQLGLLTVLADGDPLKAAKLALTQAQVQAKTAHGVAEQIQAHAAEVSAQHAIRDAIFAIADAQSNLLVAIATAAGLTVKASKESLKHAKDVLRRDLKKGLDPDSAQIKSDRQSVVEQQASLRDTQLNDSVSDINFLLSTHKIFNGQAIARLKVLDANQKLTKQEHQQLKEQIYNLQHEASQDLQFNLPSDIRLPTLYEARRFDQSGGGAGGSHYQDNRRIDIRINTNANVSAKDIADHVTAAISAPPRYGTRRGVY